MQINLLYRCIVKDKNGKIIKRSRWKKSKSFVANFLNLLDGITNMNAGAVHTQVTCVSTANANVPILVTPSTDNYANYFRHLESYLAMLALDNDDSYGIQVGTGTTAPTNSDYALATKIAHGVGAGQLDYGGHSRTSAQVVGSNVDYVISRSFYNGSGASITVNEIGIAVACMNNQGTTYYFLIVRDVITATAVANTQTLTVQYTIRTTV